MKFAFTLNSEIKEKIKDKKIVIVGVENEAVNTFYKLVDENVYVNFFCDMKLSLNKNQYLLNKKILSFSLLNEIKDEVVVIVSDLKYEQIFNILIKNGFEDIYVDSDIMQRLLTETGEYKKIIKQVDEV